MLYEMAIRLDDGQIHKLLYNTETEWLWFAENGRPYIIRLTDESRQAVKVKVPERIRRYAQKV